MARTAAQVQRLARRLQLGTFAGLLIITVSVGLMTASVLAALFAGLCYGVLLLLVAPFIPLLFGEKPVPPARLIRTLRTAPSRKRTVRTARLAGTVIAVAGAEASALFDNRLILQIALVCTMVTILGPSIWYAATRHRRASQGLD